MSEDESAERRRRRHADDPDAPAKVAKRGASITPARIITWCIFAVIFALLFVEWRTRENYNASLKNLTTVFEQQSAPEGEVSPEGIGKAEVFLTESKIREQLVGSPEHKRGEGNSRVDTYTWRFFLKRYAIEVNYGVKPQSGEQTALGIDTVE